MPYVNFSIIEQNYKYAYQKYLNNIPSNTLYSGWNFSLTVVSLKLHWLKIVQ